MTNLHRLLALAAIAAIPAAAASAQAATPYTPAPPVTVPPVTAPPTLVLVTPLAIAETVRTDAAEGLADTSAKNLQNKKGVKVVVGVSRSGLYSVELAQKVSTKKKGKKTKVTYKNVATGSATTASPGTAENTITLKPTSYGKTYLASLKGKTVTLKLRSGFKQAIPSNSVTTWTNRTDIKFDLK